MFINEISGNSAELGSYSIVTRVGRTLLMFVAVCAFLFGIFLMWLADSLGDMLLLLPLMLYVLVAFVMNFPFFPLKWHIKVFYPVQILLWPILLNLLSLLGFGMYFLLWLICLSDRKKMENMDAPNNRNLEPASDK